MEFSDRKIAHLLAHLAVGVLMAAIIIQFVAVGMGLNQVFWPRFTACLVTAISILVAATIVAKAESGQSDDGLGISLFTFANSASALVPMFAEILNSSSVKLSPNLENSVLFEIFEAAGWPDIFSFFFFVILVFVAAVFLYDSARKIAQRSEVSWVASSASVVILTLQTVLLTPWESSALLNTPLMMLVLLLAMTFMFSGVLIFALKEIPAMTRSAAELAVELSFSTLKTLVLVLYLAAKRFLFLLFWFLLPLVVFVEVFMPIGSKAVDLLFILFSSAETASFFYDFGRLIVSAGKLVLFGLGLVLFLGWVSGVPERLRAAQSVFSWVKSLFLRLVFFICIASIIGLLLFGAAVVLRGAWGWVFTPQPYENDAVTEALPDQEVKNEIASEPTAPSDVAPKTVLPQLAGYINRPVEIQCDGNPRDFGWRHASSEQVSLALSSCSIVKDPLASDQGFYLILSSSSTESLSNLERENRLALERARRASDWVARNMYSNNDLRQVFVLNLGMHLEGAAGIPERLQVSSEVRPFSILRFDVSPSGAKSEYETAINEIQSFVRGGSYAENFALCDLYTADYAPVGDGYISRVSDWDCSE
ncbi:MAG: hypothetical protein ABJH52_08570 [Henriciella sp.]